MTLIISSIGIDTAFQVSDRLTTVPVKTQAEPKLRPYDAFANKNVIYRARDALVSVGISGFAYLEDRPVDQWVAEALVEDNLGDCGAIGLVVGGPGPADLWTAVRPLRERLEHAFAAMRPKDRGLQSMAIVGWQRRGGRPGARRHSDRPAESLPPRRSAD